MFETLQKLPPDAIIGIMALFRADPSAEKVDLSVGVYQDENNQTPIFDSVRQAERRLIENQATKSYVGITGNADFNAGMQALIFGEGNAAVEEDRVATVQSPGGSGGLCVAGHLLHRAKANTRVWLSDPSWPNHRPLLQLAGLKLADYAYYDQRAHRVDFEGMVQSIESMHAGDVLLLHGCCHNPCGADLSHAQWHVVAELCQRRKIIPFIDLAYQGLSEGLDEDAYGVRLMTEHVPELIVVASCSKNFGLYRERVGSVSVVAKDKDSRDTILTNLASVARGLYSMPPDHGAAIVGSILHDAELRSLWLSEVKAMRERINSLRRLFVEKIAARGTPIDFSFIENERGMFSFLGLDKATIVRLREEFHVYMVETSRINLAGINSSNVDYVADSIAAVLGS